MAKILNVDYEQMPVKAGKMRETGVALNAEMTSAYASIANMHSSWYGRRYNDLVTTFNEFAPIVNNMLTLVVKTVPFALETVANNYSQADRGENIRAAVETEPNRIQELAIHSDVGMRFLSSEVSSVQSQVQKNFQSALEKLETIQAVFNEIQWESEAATAFRTEFSSLKGQISNGIAKINTEFKNLMEQAQTDIQNAESANTVK